MMPPVFGTHHVAGLEEKNRAELLLLA